MEILWWWAPAGAVTLVAVLWVSWYGRSGRGALDRDQAVARMGRALTRNPVHPTERPARPRDRSSGIAVRPVRRTPPHSDAARGGG